MRVLVVGDVALDVLVMPATVPVAGADVPAQIQTRPGGAGAGAGRTVTSAGRGGDPALARGRRGTRGRPWSGERVLSLATTARGR